MCRRLFWAALLLAAPLSRAALPPQSVTLSWQAAPVSTDEVFIVLISSNITASLTNWATLTNVAPTNSLLAPTTNPCTYFQPVLITPGQWFLVVEGSNWWGISQTSNVAFTPPAALPVAIINITKP